jgi:D-tyrosyl-tRNA(Tyr) deacylase
MLVLIFSKEDEFSQKIFDIMYKKEALENLKNNGIDYILIENSLFLTDKDIEEFSKERNWKDPEFLIISKHKSKHDINMITLHYPGNFNSAELGGIENKLSTPAIELTYFIYNLIKNNKDPKFYIEATHHGPSLSYPLVFFEIGPNEQAYCNENNLEYYVEILDKVLNGYKAEHIKTIGLIGSEHYLDIESINRLKEKINNKKELGEFYFSHIMPKYALIQALEQSDDKLYGILKEFVNQSKTRYIALNKGYMKQFARIKEQLIQLNKEIEFEIIVLK